MGKKAKVGKARKDKYYDLAKQTGYRSRASFKLIQLNREYGFLNQARVVIDLCAAPGGWLQVVAENTPVSCLIVGVDLVPIRPVDRCITLQGDITTDKCRQSLKKELQTWHADCVINDGAPNIGKNWQHDAYNQSELTLSALKLATEFLRGGGWFVTKLFRSKDYFKLDWVFRQLFKKVHATKPKASRNESAEIFVVCQHFKAPGRVDPKFLDPKFVFSEVQMEPSLAIDLRNPEKKRRHREGYAEGDYTMFHKLSASEFVRGKDFLEKLAVSSMIELDDAFIANHPATTEELKACMADIKVLGRKDIKAVLAWRKTVLKDLEKADKTRMNEEAGKETSEGTEKSSEEDDETGHELTAEEEKLLADEAKIQKRKARKEKKLAAKKRQRVALKLDLPGDRLDFGDNSGVFSLAKIRTKQDLDAVRAGDLSFLDGDYSQEEEEVDVVLRKRRQLESYDKQHRHYALPSELPSDDEAQEEPSLQHLRQLTHSDSESEEEEELDANPLVVEMESSKSRLLAAKRSWFAKDVFAGLESEEDEAAEEGAAMADIEQRGGVVTGRQVKALKRDGPKDKNDVEADIDDDDDADSKTGNDDEGLGIDADSSDDDSEDDEDDDSETSEDEGDEGINTSSAKGSSVQSGSTSKKKKDAELEVVPVDRAALRLDPVGLAIGTAMVCSRKRKRDMIDGGYNRYMRGEGEDLPDWFFKDEKKHCHPQLPVTKEEVTEQMLKLRALDARPIHKVAEAKQRKKKKMAKRLEKARRKAEAIGETVDVSEKEKVQHMKQIYKRAGLLGQKRQETTYVVAKKGMGKRARRPQGVKGHYKVVDPRMKKDRRAEKAATNKRGAKGKSKKSAKLQKHHRKTPRK